VSPLPTHLPSRVLGRYAMYEQFAAGGMATLHFGRLLGPSGFSRTVAIKRLHAHLAEDPDFVAMFLDEARLAARIHHPNVIQTLDVESSEGELFVVLDYVHGDSLSRLLQEARRVSAPATPAIIGTILFGGLEGLHAAHEARDAKGDPLELVHRDVSPHNFLVGTDGIARVLDFGVAKARGRAQTTRGGQLKGKLAYMAPEQLRGKVTRRTDVFAASVVLWEALTGRRLFEGDDEGDVINNILHEAIPSPRQYAPLVTPELEGVVMRGLERDPARRFATAREMAIALESQVTLATPIEVGAFVERIGGATLAQRAARVGAIETECSDALDPEHEGATRAEVGPVRPPAMSVAGATSATAAVPGLARADDRTTVDVVAESVGTGVATVSEMHAPRQRRLVGAVSVASLIGAVTVLGLALAVRAGVRHSPERSSSVESRTPPFAAPTLPTPSSVPALPADSTAPGEAREAHPPPTDASSKKTLAPHLHPRTGCSPAYTIDARGLRHYKPECI
jgi:eukaryotic-like serine/threonine-protein kinase